MALVTKLLLVTIAFGAFTPDRRGNCRSRTLHVFNATDDDSMTTWEFARVEVEFMEPVYLRLPNSVSCRVGDCERRLNMALEVLNMNLREGYPMLEGNPLLKSNMGVAWILRGSAHFDESQALLLDVFLEDDHLDHHEDVLSFVIPLSKSYNGNLIWEADELIDISHVGNSQYSLVSTYDVPLPTGTIARVDRDSCGFHEEGFVTVLGHSLGEHVLLEIEAKQTAMAKLRGGLDIIMKPTNNAIMKPVVSLTVAQLKPDLMPAFTEEMFHSLNNEVGPLAGPQLAANVEPIVAANLLATLPLAIFDALMESLSRTVGDFLAVTLDQQISPAIIQSLSESLQESIPTLVGDVFADELGRILEPTVAHGLSRSLVHIIGTAVGTMGGKGGAETVVSCRKCFDTKEDCQSCPVSEERMRDSLYYTQYYSEYYSEYYNPYAISALIATDIATHPE